MTFADLLRLLCCPACRGDLTNGASAPDLYCHPCGFTFPVIEGIPVLFPCDVKANMETLFGRYWDSTEKAELYDAKVEGNSQIFGVYNHESEIYGLTRYFTPGNLDLVLDAGTGNGRFMETFPGHSVKVGIDASFNLLKRVKQRGRGDFLVCAELEHIPFRDAVFGTVISCRVLQHLKQQQQAVHEMGRVTRPGGDVILELYNTWNLKTIYKNIRMSPKWGPILNAPFRRVFRSMSPFGPWAIGYDSYNNWFQTKRWMTEAGLRGFMGRGVGFGIHKYLAEPFYFNVFLGKRAPRLLRGYYAMCMALERVIGSVIPWRYTMEKFSIKATRGAASDRPARQ